MASGVDLNITVSRTETRMTVLVMPKVSGLKAPGQNHIVPFTLTGAPAEIDQGFFPALQQALSVPQGFFPGFHGGPAYLDQMPVQVQGGQNKDG